MDMFYTTNILLTSEPTYNLGSIHHEWIKNKILEKAVDFG